VEIDLLVLGSFCVEGKESFCSWKKRKEEEDFSRRKRRRRRRRATSRFLFWRNGFC
jgi:polynucleotide 5'-kinase involved in rRNA processing